MVLVVIPFLDSDIVGTLDIFQNPFQTVRYGIIYYPPAIFDNQNQMIIEREHRMVVTF